MENWSYNIKHWWALHGRDVKRYGLCAFIVMAGIHADDYFTAWIGLFIAAAMVAYDRFDGVYWQQRGQQVLYPSKFPKKEEPKPKPQS